MIEIFLILYTNLLSINLLMSQLIELTQFSMYYPYCKKTVNMSLINTDFFSNIDYPS